MLMRCRTFWRVFPTVQHTNFLSSTIAGVSPSLATTTTNSDNELPKATDISSKHSTEQPVRGKQKLTSAVFSSLKEVDGDGGAHDELDSKIATADTTEQLLSIAGLKHITSNQALKIVSKLADWTTEGKAKLIDFESDPRFTKLCQKLGHSISTKPARGTKVKEVLSPAGFSDLGVVLGVAGDDEAAKLVNTITVPQMIKVLLSLAYKKRRSTPLLRSLAFNIGKSTDDINIKDCADVLYACYQLSFQDEVLFEKISSDLCQCIAENQKPAVIGSIITSLGCLRYKNKELLDQLSEWVLNNISVCRIQDVVSLILTLATVNYSPANEVQLFEKLESYVQQSDITSPSIWLDVVWAMVILNRATGSHIASVLDAEFITKLTGTQPDNNLSIISRMKLLNINGAAQLLIKNYSGPLLEENEQFVDVAVPRAKDKQTLVNCVLDTLVNLLPSSEYVNMNVNTGMGFIIDGQFVVDSNANALPLIDKKTGLPIDTTHVNSRKGIKIAILVLDYHDVTRGQSDPVGVAGLAIRLAQKSGYQVLTVPYSEFNAKDKLVTRVQYIEEQIKNVIKHVKAIPS